MPLKAGQQVAHYRIVEKIGEGGMGEVYRAEDTKLGRSVAIKVLPETFVQNHAALARFSREAQLLASLNHPNIAGIHGLEESGGITALALELVEGETLAQRIARGPMPVEEAVRAALQIAEALEAAHEKGIIHRDLKPANVKFAADGRIKVLDFGLAKAMAGDTSQIDATQSPTISMQATAAGAILGTASYMSPEQARGQPVDQRADLWAFGCVFYEMVTGRPAFGGDSVTDILAGLITRDPEWDALPAGLPDSLRRLLRRCLQKDADRRLRHAGDARLDLADADGEPELPGEDATEASARSSGIGIGLTAALVLVALVAGALGGRLWLTGTPQATAEPVVRFSLPAPPDHDEIWAPALAADGSFVVYEGWQGDTTKLYLHEFESGETRPLQGTAGAGQPFVSPDGRWIGFQAGDRLMKVAAHGGDTLTIANSSRGSPGASWGDDGTILYPNGWLVGLQAVSADGGEPRVITTPDSQRGEKGHWWPHFLPGGRHALFTVWMAGAGLADSHIALLDMNTGKYERLFRGAHAFYLHPGYIVYYRAGQYHAVRFELSTLKTMSEPLVVIHDASDPAPQGNSFLGLAVAPDGTLVYSRRQTPGAKRLAWLEPGGEPEILPFPARQIDSLSLAPDGRFVVASSLEDGTFVIRMLDLITGTDDLVNLAGGNWDAHWAPDGSGFSFLSMRKGDFDIYFKNITTGEPERPLWTSDTDEQPKGWSADGTEVLVWETQSNGEVWLKRLPFNTDGEAGLLSKSQGITTATVSGDGKWLAFSARNSDRPEIYVQAYPGPAAALRASRQGGLAPAWSADGRLLYFTRGDDIIALDFRTEGSRFIPGKETVVATAPLGAQDEPLIVTEGPRFLVPIRTEVNRRPELQVVLNWNREVQRLMATGD